MAGIHPPDAKAHAYMHARFVKPVRGDCKKGSRWSLCSESILSLADPDELMQSVYAAAASTGLFASSGAGGIKVRLHPYRHFTNVDARVREHHGRPDAGAETGALRKSRTWVHLISRAVSRQGEVCR